jgi:hypothetical protein
MWGNLGQTVAGGLGSLATGYLQMRPPASPAQAGYGYPMNSQPYNPWEY